MTQPVVLDAIRTPLGALHGALATQHPVELLGRTVAALVARVGVGHDVSEVIAGCVEQVGGQGGNVALGAARAAGLAATSGGTTVDRGGTSGVEAARLAAALVQSGSARAVVAGAVDVMSLVPAGAAAMGRHPYGRPWISNGDPAGPRLPPGAAADALAARAGIDRGAQDAWAARSVTAALGAGAGRHRLIAVGAAVGDELPATRPRTPETLASCPPLHQADGTVTAGNAAPPADGAAALLVADARWAADAGLVPLATLLASAAVAGPGDDPVGPAVAAAHLALAAAGIGLGAVDRIELHEPFAVVALAVVAALGLDPARVNIAGGALAYGHAPAAAGLVATVDLVHALHARDQQVGLVVVPAPGLGAALVLGRRSYAALR